MEWQDLEEYRGAVMSIDIKANTARPLSPKFLSTMLFHNLWLDISHWVGHTQLFIVFY